MTDLTRALADPDQPGAMFRAVEALAAETIGVKLFTVMTLDTARGIARRAWSNMPDAYPVSGEKPMESSDWLDRIVTRQQTFVTNDAEGIAAVFPDHELIHSLGCESCLNLPIVIAGRTFGTLNCLHGPGHYTPERVAAAEALKIPGALALLLAVPLTQGQTHA